MALQKRSLSLASHRTSIALEPEFWSALEDIARERGISQPALIADIDQRRTQDVGLAQACRIYALGWYRGRAR